MFAGVLLLGLIAWILWAVGSARRQLRELRSKVGALQNSLERSGHRGRGEARSSESGSPPQETLIAKAELMEQLPRVSPRPIQQVSRETGSATEIDTHSLTDTNPPAEKPTGPVPDPKNDEAEEDVDLPINEAKLAEIPFHNVLSGGRDPKKKKD